MGLSVKENTRRSGGESSRTITKRTTKRSLIVCYDGSTPPASIAVVETADDGTTAIPPLYEGLAGDDDRVVTDVSVKPRDDTGLNFDVVVTYETLDAAEFPDSPLTVPVDYDWDFSGSSKPYFWDETPDGDGGPQPTINSAFEPFDNLLEREEGEIVVTVTDNIAPEGWDPVQAAAYCYPAFAKNDAPMTIEGVTVDTGQVRIGGIKCSGLKTSNGTDYRTRVIVLKLRASWDHVVDDRGRHELYTDTGDGFIKLREIVKGTPPTKAEKPWPLDGAGGAQDNADDDPEELTFVPYPAKDFGVWGIT